MSTITADRSLKEELQQQNAQLLLEFRKRHLLTPEGELLPGVVQKHYTDGTKYEGFQSPTLKRTGYGIYTYKAGDLYAGMWSDDKFNGDGMYLFKNGERYIGQLVNGQREGEGRYEYVNGSRYEGGWKKDKKHGRGKFDSAFGGESYEGEYVNGDKSGQGVFLFAAGQRYEGSWSKNEKSGFGKLTFPDGSYFEGNWLSVFCDLPIGQSERARYPEIFEW